ncbi:hypothetical protein A5752_24535 [Mycobacterium sp. 852002-51961_SCH5331710]|uniref:hypothetical protein n=1 Tax=Mycobacterium sp. IS-1590 TaxID=1772286 RepID=UPI0007473439|nr:hypothetical protein [Mycobacterium sp. IS-1590]KUI41178.1 hypothetical protein AU197_01120 [Mycobacterium sp. IS-1590]OBB47150.1 hypothetical protein A5752_24535 [Mycobacterium sp. 852002-51961_SCH5331710]
MDATSKHLRVTDTQCRHLSPAQSGVGQETHDRRIRPDFNRELLNLPVSQVTARPPFAARKLDSHTRIACDTAVLDRHLQHLTQNSHSILDGGRAGTGRRQRLDPRPDVGRLHVGDSYS